MSTTTANLNTSAHNAAATSNATDVTRAPHATNAINWFEIPCADLDRAQTFYEQVLARPMRREAFGGAPMALFSYEQPATGGCLIKDAERQVAPNAGVRIYLDCSPGLDAAAYRVPLAGGKLLDACITLPDGMGYIAHLRDTEGNTIGLHAINR